MKPLISFIANRNVNGTDNFRSGSVFESIFRIWYVLLKIYRTWMQILIKWIPDGYGRGYGIHSPLLMWSTAFGLLWYRVNMQTIMLYGQVCIFGYSLVLTFFCSYFYFFIQKKQSSTFMCVFVQLFASDMRPHGIRSISATWYNSHLNPISTIIRFDLNLQKKMLRLRK
jgi:hypothetical protein